MTEHELVQKILNKDVRALSRAISLIENNHIEHQKILVDLQKDEKRSHIIGLTGSTGVGKSSLITQIIKIFRNDSKSVAVLAIDPTSPYTGGSLLGDRIRMLEFTNDRDVYIRSMASRGSSGGLAKAAFSALTLLEGAGYDLIIVETVGAGQSEVDVANYCDTTILVQSPGLGDDIQLMKAGIMEIADIYVVNKADKEGADQLRIKINKELVNQKDEKWKIPIILTNSLSGKGVFELVRSIQAHATLLTETNSLPKYRTERYRREVILNLETLIDNKINELIILKDNVLTNSNQGLTPMEQAELLFRRHFDRDN